MNFKLNNNKNSNTMMEDNLNNSIKNLKTVY